MSELELIREHLAVVDRLLGDNGCPWDKEQTMRSARKYVLEEVSELIEAIDLEDNPHIEEELGDLFYNAIFLSRLAAKEGRATLQDAVRGITEKLIRRHPHIFGTESATTAEEVIHHWETAKRKEKETRQSVFDGIPKNLPSLSRAQKIADRLKNKDLNFLSKTNSLPQFQSEEELGELLFDLAKKADALKIDPEQALRKYLARLEQEFRRSESLMP